MLGPFATASRRYIASHQVSLLSHASYSYSAGVVRCPQRRQRQRVTEGTAMAPWNGPNHCLTVSPCRMLLLASAAKSKSIVQAAVSTSHSSNVDEPRTLIQTALELDVSVIDSMAQSSTMQRRRSVRGVRRSTVSSVLRVSPTRHITSHGEDRNRPQKASKGLGI